MYYFEKINHNKNLPMRIFLHNLRSAPHHWHSEMELLLVLNGSITIECEGGSHLLKTNDLFLINGNMAHATSALQDNLVLVLQIDREYFDGVCPGFGQMRFLIDTTDVPQPDTACHDLRVLMARLMYVITKQEEGSSLMALSCLNRLCLTLVKKYRSGTLSGKYVVDPDNERLNQIIQYISQHFSEDISISDIADALHISRSYLSRFFSQTMGVSLSKYITDIRLKKSLDMLKNTDKNVSQIAYECGFPLAKSYYSAFHKAYGTTPAKYKRDMLPSSPQPATEFNYLEIDLPNAFQQLYMFLEEEKENDPSPGPITGITDNRIFIDTAANLGPYKNVTRKIGCFGRAAEGLRDDWRRDFTRLQKDIGYEYMRCHGIFHDEMGVYRETPKGPVYDFSNIDSLYDFLLEHRARPYVELGFMPRDLASADQTVFWWKGYIAKPKSMEKWLDLIEAFLLHLQDRYGKEELRLWYFEIWNEPDVASFWADGQESYYELFSSTYRRIKDIDPKLRVGGFSLAHCDIGPMLPWIAQKCHEDGIQPDFFSYHNYPFEAIIFTPSDYDGKDENRDSLYQNLFRQYFRRIGADGMEAYMKRTEEKVRRLFPGIKEIFVTEWNASFYPRELISDTLYMAAFVAKNQLYMNEHTDGAGFWTFTDIFEEMKMTPREFHGGFGLMTQHGIPKPQYYAMCMLSRIQGKLLLRQENCIATLTAAGIIQILFFHYVHLDQMYSSMDTSGVLPRRRNTCFEPADDLSVACTLKCPSGSYRLVKELLSTEQGSAFDAWVRLGADEVLNDREISYLKQICVPKMSTEQIQVQDSITLHLTLKPHEVAFWELTPRSPLDSDPVQSP